MRKSIKKRQEKILSELSREKTIQVATLFEDLDVSNETLRKDLISMEKQGLIRRHHGSVTLITKGGEDRMSVRQFSEIPAKYRIAEAALELIPKNQLAIGLDAGNTVYFLARLLAERSGYTIITNSLDSAGAFADGSGSNTVYCTGGEMRDLDRALYGQTALDNLKSMRLSIVFLGSAGVKNKSGIGGISFDELNLKREMCRISELTVALFDSTKFDKTALLDTLSWDEIDIVITDSRIRDEERRIIEGKTQLITV